MLDRLTQLLNFSKESPNDPFLKYALTMEYKKMGDAAKTEQGFKELLNLHADYVGTYYHYAKFLEEKNRKEEALLIYEKGMEIATLARNKHAFGELKAAYQLAKGIDDEDWDD